MEELSFLFNLTLPVLIIGTGYYYFTERRKNRLFGQFEDLRREAHRVENPEDLEVLEVKAMAWNSKIKLASETPWRTELFMIMREKRNYFKEEYGKHNI